jgi:ABC-type amino acid transport substrate-binding protein
LHVGDIDILVSTYANKDVEEVVDVIKPGYLLDPVVVYMRKGTGSHINRWDDLIGKRGVKTVHFLFNSDFEDYINRYLYVHSKGDLANVVELVSSRKVDYIIGSRLQLEHGVKYAGLQNSLELLQNISHPDEVHMGYSKTSSCRMYLPYLRKRLLDLKEDGTIDEIVARYLAQDQNIINDDDTKDSDDIQGGNIPLR